MEHQIIYFHGLDKDPPKIAEISRQTQFETLSKRLNANIWIARSSQNCKNLKCWPHQSPEAIKQEWEKIKSSSSGCIDFDKPTGLIGFSNGGYYVTKLMQTCQYPNVIWGVATGSSGNMSSSLCGDLHLLIGKRDLTYTKAKNFFLSMKKKHTHIFFHDFHGGHDLNFDSLFKIIEPMTSLQK